jgi:hypothetical protein
MQQFYLVLEKLGDSRVSSPVTSVRFTEAAFYSSEIPTAMSQMKLSIISNTRLGNYTRYQN